MPLTTHVAESDEEFAMFTHASGPLYEFLTSLQRPMSDCCGQTPFAQLWNSGAINHHWILAHMNQLHEADFALLERLPAAAKPTIVHCPGTHAYFERPPFAWSRLQQLGVNLCVGTDSLASTDSLSLLAELRRLSAAEPQLSGEDLLRTVTIHPARALDAENDLGRIRPGAAADLIAIPFTGSLDRVYDEIIEYDRPVPWMMIDGQVKSSAS
jgi:cytosine/adenosine deaminase-related metal-dependent hydrolase